MPLREREHRLLRGAALALNAALFLVGVYFELLSRLSAAGLRRKKPRAPGAA